MGRLIKSGGVKEMVDRKKLHDTIDKYGLLHKKTIEVSQELDQDVVNKQKDLLRAKRVEDLYMQGRSFKESLGIVKNEGVRV